MKHSPQLRQRYAHPSSHKARASVDCQEEEEEEEGRFVCRVKWREKRSNRYESTKRELGYGSLSFVVKSRPNDGNVFDLFFSVSCRVDKSRPLAMTSSNMCGLWLGRLGFVRAIL